MKRLVKIIAKWSEHRAKQKDLARRIAAEEDNEHPTIWRTK